LAVDQAFLNRREAVLNNLQRFQTLARADADQRELAIQQSLVRLIRVARKSTWWQTRLEPLGQVGNLRLNQILQQLPVLTREEVQTYSKWMQIFIPGSTPEQYFETSTSGSTGKPVTISKYMPGINRQHLAIQLMDAIWQKRNLAAPMAYIRNNTETYKTEGQQEPFCYIAETGPAHFKQLPNSNIRELLEFLAENEIENLLLNGVVTRILAKEQLANPYPGLKLAQILSWADRVDESLRELVREAFNAKICDRYSSEEFGYLAIQCPEAEHLHALQFHNFIEILDQENKPCKPGQLGRVVVTGLRSFGMPLIRYELGDLASWAEPCQHGIKLPVFEPNITRIRDAEIDDDGTIRLPRINRTLLAKAPGILDYQVVKFNDQIIALYRASRVLSESDISQIKSEVAEALNKTLPVEVLTDSNLDWLKLWKRKIIVNINQPAPDPVTLDALKAMLAEANEVVSSN